MSVVGDRIKFYRKLAGITQAEVAEYLNVGRATVNKYEKGVIDNLPVKNVEEIARVLNVKPQTLMGWEDPEPEIPIEERIRKGIELIYGAKALELLITFDKLSVKKQKNILAYAKDMERLELLETD